MIDGFIGDRIHRGVFDTRDRLQQTILILGYVDPDLWLGWLRHSCFIFKATSLY